MNYVTSKIEPKSKFDKYIQGIAGFSLDLVTVILFKRLIDLIGGYGLYTDYGYLNNIHDFREKFLFVENYEDWNTPELCIFVGTNIRADAPLLAASIMNQLNTNIINIASVNALPITFFDIGYDLNSFVEGKRTECYKVSKAINIHVVTGMAMGYYNNLNIKNKLIDNLYILNNCIDHNDKTCVIYQNTILAYANHGAMYEMGLKYVDDLYMLRNTSIILVESDECEIPVNNTDQFTIYIGAYADFTVAKANIILPTSTYTEDAGTFINTNGKLQKTSAIFGFLNTIPNKYQLLGLMLALSDKKLPLLNTFDNSMSKFFDFLRSVIGVTTTIKNYFTILPFKNLETRVLYIMSVNLFESSIFNVLEANTILRMSTILALSLRLGNQIPYFL